MKKPSAMTRCRNGNVRNGQLAMSILLQKVIPDAPQNLIGDNAYDSDRLDAELGSTELNSLLHIVGIVGTEGIRLRMEVG
jgi:hypothetical protein